MMGAEQPKGVPSGYVCPECGGALWERGDGESLGFECRIGHCFEAARLWIEHCAARNRALLSAARALAENAALARHLVDWADARGEQALAARLREEAAREEEHLVQLRVMLEDLPVEAPSDGSQG